MNRNSPLVAHRGSVFKRRALALAVGSAVALAAGSAFAQAVNGTIHGQVPVAPGETVQITNSSGFNRSVTVGPSGMYTVTLPVGTYTVTLLQDGKVIQSRAGVSPVAAGGVAVNFRSGSIAPTQTLAAVNVSASALPAIDTTTTNQVTTITARQLQALPLGRNSGSIAMLAPGVNLGAPSEGGGPLGDPVLSFNGASVVENAYYIDGMNMTDEVSGQGGIGLPYGAILQQQTMTTGYGARYGRSIGGVVNQIGKAGSNDWHFGVRAQWEPSSWRSNSKNTYWANPLYTGPNQSEVAGQLEDYNKNDSGQETVYDAYVSGPIIRNKLTFFLAAEQDDTSGYSIGSVNSPFQTSYQDHAPKLYTKVNWNINNNNILTVTALQNQLKTWSSNYHFDYNTLETKDLSSLGLTRKTSYRMWVANYTSYITDNLTLHAMLGKIHGEFYTQQPAFAGYDPTLPFVGGVGEENPAFTPNGPILNDQTQTSIQPPNFSSSIMNYRLSLDWKLGAHTLHVGIDNIQSRELNGGNVTSGPGYTWSYAKGDPGTPIIGTNPTVPPYVGPPNSNAAGADGYYVAQGVFENLASVRVSQRAQYIEDNWNVTSRLLLNIGVRNDQYIDFDPAGVAFRLTKPQWQPRVGFSWDVRGDSTLKVFGNAGRYYISLPTNAVLGNAGAITSTSKYFTYTGIDPVTAVPTGLQQITQNNGGHGDMGVSADHSYGQALNPRTVGAQNLKGEYSDNFVLGAEQQFRMLGSRYVVGADAVLQKMGPDIIDDWDDMPALCAAALAQGVTGFGGATLQDQINDCVDHTNGYMFINPTQTAVTLIPDDNGDLKRVIATNAVQGFPRKVSRKYYGLNLSLEHPFDGKWFGKIIYTWSRVYGNTGGPALAALGEGGANNSFTIAWDHWQLMENSYGVRTASHTNQLRAYGMYQLNPQWQVGGNLFIESGTPTQCFGYFGAGQTDPVGYGSLYHWCGGVPTPPGSTGNTPWIHQLSLNVNYSPKWADHRVNFNLAVFNVFNNQTPTQYLYQYGSTTTPNPSYRLVVGRTAPRMARFSVDYNF